MKALTASRLPLLLSPRCLWVALAFNIGCQSTALTSLRPLLEALTIAFFLAPLLFFDWIGAIRWNLLAGDPRLFGSAWAADAVYALSSSLVLFLISKLVVALFRLRQ
jgi:hypothetical protein